jgi:mannose-6-phosphate isomerase-like protein (cupin superfamily)
MVAGKSIKIIQIVSSDSVEKKVYIQEEDEFIFILEGSAKLRIDGDIKEITKGEYLYIPAQMP